MMTKRDRLALDWRQCLHSCLVSHLLLAADFFVTIDLQFAEPVVVVVVNS